MSRAWAVWSGDVAARWARRLAIAAILVLFLESAATAEVVYTIRPSYALFVLACLVGFPFIVHGWLRLPAPLLWLGALLFGVYVAAALTGDAQVLASQERAGGHRDLIYVTDLALGLGIVGLFAGLWPPDRSLASALAALLVGAAVAATYALYQWLGQRYGWPLANLNNASNAANAGTALAAVTDTGVLGWQRARGTFAEPHFLGAYVAMLLPIAVGFLIVSARRGARVARNLLAAVVMAMTATLVVTSSLPAWETLAIGSLAALTLLLVARGLPAPAAVAGAATAVILILAPLTLLSPQTLAPLTGRGSLEFSTEFRTEAWGAAAQAWAARPVLGYGPGQSAVRVAGDTNVTNRANPTEPPRALGSAQGLWAAALVDAGIVGLCTWLLFLGGAIGIGATTLLRRPTVLRAAILAAGVTAVLGSMVTGDRFELRAWVVIAILLASSLSAVARRGQPGTDSKRGNPEPG
jgi:hypothetical protein